MIVRGQESVLVQGITGRQGSFWAEKMRAYGTRIVGGVNPKKAGTEHLGLPVWGSAVDAAKDQTIDVSVLFIPPLGVKAAVLDALAAGIKKIVVLTEHIPVQDVMYFLAAAEDAGAQIIGPNTAGLVTAGESFVGFMPAFNDRVFRPGRVGVISRSGSLGTLVCLNIVQAGFGISSFIGIGGDPVIGTTTRAALDILNQDEGTDAVALIGEIGGSMEEDAAELAAEMSKPIACFVAGSASPAGKKMGHAGAIVVGNRGSYGAKKKALEAAGVAVVPTPSGIPEALSHGLR
ncbi:MAG: succinate--CoA ligase subunit alpha [Methyloligellaceae bacterium]